MRHIITILTFLIFISQSYASESAAKKVKLDGEVVEYTYIRAHNVKIIGFGNIRSERRPAHYYIILKSSSLNANSRSQLTLQAKRLSINGPLNPMYKAELKKNEIIVLIPSSELKGLKKGSQINMKGYSLSRFTEGLASTLDSLTINGQEIKINKPQDVEANASSN